MPDDEDHVVDFGHAAVRREGGDVTIVGISRMAVTAEQAAQTLAEEHGVQAEVIDPRTLRPLDLDTVLRSVARTNRCVVVEEGWPHGGVGANLSALISEQAFDDLDAPVRRVTGADTPMPYSRPLEQAAYPHAPQVVHAALEVLGQAPAAQDGGGDGAQGAAAGSAAAGEVGAVAEIVMPRLSDTMEEGTVLRWLKRDGELVRRGEELVEIETDKAAMVYESDQEGVLSLTAREGDTLPVGATIAHVGEGTVETPAATPTAAPATPTAAPATVEVAPPPARGRGAPRARRARESVSPGAAGRAGAGRRPARPDRLRPRRADRQGGRHGDCASGGAPRRSPSAWPPPRARRRRWS